MSSELQEKIDDLRDEVRRLTADTLAKEGDAVARWQRAQAIKAQAAELREMVAALPDDVQADLARTLGQVNRGLIFLLADSNRPASIPGPEETSEQTVRRIHSRALQIAGAFALQDGDRSALTRQALALHEELVALDKQSANQVSDGPRMLSEANLDLTYVTSGGQRPFSTRLAHWLTDARRSQSTDS
jgi:hypothetical protein